MTNEEFLSTIKDGCVKGWQSHAVLASISGAQAILESNWGKSTLAIQANNLFGIKGDYNGASYTVQTKEFISGVVKYVDAAFRKYPSWSESITDHGAFFTSTEFRKSNYAAVVGETDYKIAAQALSTAGYATDPDYPAKLIKLIETYDLAAWDVNEEETKVVKVYISPSSQDDNVGVGSFGTEETRMNQIADVVETELKRVGITTLRNSPSMDITQMVAASNAFGADVHLSIHSNAGGGTGAEAYYYTGSTAGQALAQAVYNNLTPMTPTGDRGVKATTQLYEVWATNAVATLVEVAFHDNPTDAAFILNNIQSIGIALAKGVCSYFGINFGSSNQAAVAAPVVAASGVVFTGQAHVQSKGWLEMAGNVLGTVGEGLRLEAFSLVVKNNGVIQSLNGSIHIQDIGDVAYNSGTNIFGTVGQEKRLEAILINVGNGVQYRTHVANQGWGDWVRSGEWSGTKEQGLRIEAIEFRIG